MNIAMEGQNSFHTCVVPYMKPINQELCLYKENWVSVHAVGFEGARMVIYNSLWCYKVK